MKIEVLPSKNSYCDDDKNLEILLDAFSSVVSLEDIASAYCQTGRDVYAAGELLCDHKGSILASSGSKEDPDGVSSSKLSTDNLLEKSCVERNSTAQKQRNRPVSMGTVSGVIGREYSKTKPSSYEQSTVRKPLKFNSSELPPSEVWGEQPPDSVATNETMKKDVEEFVFKMLGDGFILDMGVIREVLGLCGYDVNKSMEKLLDLSASKLNENDGYSCMREKKSFEAKGFPSNKVLHPRGSTRSSETGMFTGVETDSPKMEKDTYDLQKDILNSLLSVPGRIEDAPKRIIRPVRGDRRGRFGRPVLEPPEDTPIEPRTFAKPKVTKDDDDETDESYDALRRAHMEYFTTMREYYKSVVMPPRKGTTSIGFIFRDGIIVASDSRITCEQIVVRDDVCKIFILGPRMLCTMVGDVSVCRRTIHQLYHLCLGFRDNNMTEPSAHDASRMLLGIYSYEVARNTNVSCSSLIASWSEAEGPILYHVESRPFLCLQGTLFSIGSGAPYASGVLQAGERAAREENDELR